MRDNDAIYTEKKNGLTIKVYQSDCHESPREWDNLGTMVCFHKRHNLGDKHTMSIEEAKELSQSKDVVSLPLFLYDHSGITISTKPFSCPWDSGQVGFIYITKEKIKAEYGNAGKKGIEKAIKYMQGEVREYDNFLTGNVYGFVIEDENGENIDSCSGFFGDYDGKEFGALHEARAAVDYMTHQGTTDHNGQVLLPVLASC